MGKTFGYVRVSTADQNLDRQIHAIKTYCTSIKDEDLFKDKKTGVNFEREQYQKLRLVLREGDTLIIKDTSRLGRNKYEVKKELEYFREKNVLLRILAIPTTLIEVEGNSKIMDLVNAILLEVFTSLDEIDYDERRVKQKEGIARAKDKGKYRGRKAIEINLKQFKKAFDLWDDDVIKITDVEKMLEINRQTFYKKAREYRSYRDGEAKRPDWLI